MKPFESIPLNDLSPVNTEAVPDCEKNKDRWSWRTRNPQIDATPSKQQIRDQREKRLPTHNLFFSLPSFPDRLCYLMGVLNHEHAHTYTDPLYNR